MRKPVSLTLLFIVMAFVLSLTNCRETKEEKAKDTIEEVTDDIEKATEEIGDAAKTVKKEVKDLTDDN